MNKNTLITLVFIFLCSMTHGQTTGQDTTEKKYFIGSSLFMLGNFSSNNTPDFAQLNFGYRLTTKDVASLELITWKYAWPLGIPWGDDKEADEFEYPGYIREFGLALAYQRYLWKNLYAAIHALNAHQTYVDENGDKIQNGYQLFMTYRVGYHIPLFKNVAFIEPSVALTHWPINTNVPDAFKQQEDDWNNYFLFEPGLHFGINL